MAMKFDSRKINSGFTLVEMALVMLGIGLLIGGIFGGLQLKKNAQAMDIVKQFKLYEASAIKFKDVYGELPGDLRDPAARLVNCNAAPCNRAGDGDGILDDVASTANWTGVITTGSERFVFWNHLLSAGLISGFSGTDNLNFGEGQPPSDLRGGYRVTYFSGFQFNFQQVSATPHLFSLIGDPSGVMADNLFPDFILPCTMMANIDRKTDDGFPFTGRVTAAGGCSTNFLATSTYDQQGGLAIPWYLTKF